MAEPIPIGGRLAAGRVTLVDDADADLARRYVWHFHTAHNGRGYARGYLRGGDGRLIYLHHLLTGQRHIDHANGDGLDNQRSNLRPATHGQNLANTAGRRNRRNRFKGVYRHPRWGRWQAYITVNRKRRHLGTFATEEEAARAYDAAAREAWGEFARLNLSG